VYVVDVNGRVWALSLGSGKSVPGWPVMTRRNPADFVWGALTLSRGWLYTSIASLCDAGYYHGGVIAINTRAPRRIRRWDAVPGTVTYGGGVWGWGGVSIDAGTGDVFAATGNSEGVGGEGQEGAEAVVQLSATLVVKQYDQPLAPPFQVADRDFGTTPVLLDASGCPPQLVAINKDGELLLYDRAHISMGPRQRIWVADSAHSVVPLIGLPAFDPLTRTLVLVSPSTPSTPGLRAGVQAFTLTQGCTLAARWSRPFDPPAAGSAPTIAGGVIYLGSGRDGYLRAFRLSDGRRIWSWGPSHHPIFAAPVVDRETLYAAGWSGYVWAFTVRH
jgi:outer membrane protein assembly factor BamB